jgi:hypothetical protein
MEILLNAWTGDRNANAVEISDDDQKKEQRSNSVSISHAAASSGRLPSSLMHGGDLPSSLKHRGRLRY